jgi:uncharacterized membrane protein YfcA
MPTVEQALLLTVLFFGAAVLYGMVGHAGASAYLAAMAFVGLSADVMKPTALVLNILVAVLVTAQFARAGFVRPLPLLPFLIGSIPLAFLGGSIHLPSTVYKPLVGVVLLIAAGRFGLVRGQPDEFPLRAPWPLAVMSGATLGLLAGLTGTGGGIFLTPLLLIAGWAGTRFAAGSSALFILANSVSGLAGAIGAAGQLPAQLPLWLGAVAVGGFTGSQLGSRHLPAIWVRRALAVVLVIAGLKLIFVG